MNKNNLILFLIIILVISGILLVILYFDNLNWQGGDENQTTSHIYTNTTPPSHTVKLIFIHHSTGENWLSDENGGLGIALRDNNYFVSDTNYGWGPDSIGDLTDIGHWWLWFRGPDSSKYTDALYNESGQNCEYSRLSSDPGGENEIIIFKSCFPNSALQGSSSDVVPSIASNPLKGESSDSEFHTVANAKGIYIDLLEYFKTRPDKLFIIITAPPLSDPTYGENAHSFNQWLVNDWLDDYPYKNVAVFDFYSVLTNGGNTLAYPSSWGDDHPSQAGNQKATQEFTNFLNNAYHEWKDE
ncbi:MAG: hypothetical protein A4E25_00823 [Methanobacterium sp. PtaB.Bin024]|jgi:hypothetical protein|nr:MAG: hypothetical protein A4E25_00823 [Methanobacterium sp. PtaB.Bin024]